MYAAVPRIVPTPVIIAGVVIVGDIERFDGEAVVSTAFASPKSRTLTVPSLVSAIFAGFQIPMNDSFLMGGFERLCDLPGDPERLLDRNPAARDALVQALAVHEFENKELLPVEFVEAVDLRDMRMIQGGEELGFATEASDTIRIVRERYGHDLERDFPSELGVFRAIDFAHAAAAEQGDDLVAAEP